MKLLHSAQRKHAFLVKAKGKSKSQKQILKRKVSLELLHQILGHRSTRSLLAVDNANFWKDIDLRVDPDPFYTSYQISKLNKKARSKTTLNPKTPFKWVFMVITPDTSSKSLTK